LAAGGMHADCVGESRHAYIATVINNGRYRAQDHSQNWGYHMRIFHLAGALALLAGVLACCPDGAVAQGSDAVRQACTPDAMRLCGDVVPDVAKTTACMKAKYRLVSAECRMAMRGGAGGGHRVYGHHHYTERHQYTGHRHCHHCG
jgi:hypothetical protein